jgi:hypothetical protein
MLAHVNTTGQNINLWLDGNVPGIGWGQSDAYPYQEGSFFGNIFIDNPKAFFCNGRDFDQGVVPGRLGANQTGAPYKPAAPGPNSCDDVCAAMDAPYQLDGYKACNGYNHVITVWRNFDANTNYKICNRKGGRCLDAGASIADGSAIVQNSYVATAMGQKWRIIQVNPKQYKVVNAVTGKALAISGKLTANGTAIVQRSFAGGTDQLWSFTSMADKTGFHAISPVMNAGSVIALPSATSGQGAPVQEWAWDPAAFHMQWTIQLAN